MSIGWKSFVNLGLGMVKISMFELNLMHVSDYVDSEVGLDSPKTIHLLSFN